METVIIYWKRLWEMDEAGLLRDALTQSIVKG
jgi:hypothetical protein